MISSFTAAICFWTRSRRRWSAQLQMELRQGRRNSVDIIGGVVNPGSYPLRDRNLALTNLCSTLQAVSIQSSKTPMSRYIVMASSIADR